jgi:hypothetical protein
MSTWLLLTNDIKRRCSANILTPTQIALHDRLCKIMRSPDWANLHGAYGSGKTFLAWTVAQSINARYLPVPSMIVEIEETQQTLIIDNAPYQEKDVRNLFSQCELIAARAVLLVTYQPVILPMLQLELPLPTSEDIEQVSHFIKRSGYFFEGDRLPENPSFWDIMLASV